MGREEGHVQKGKVKGKKAKDAKPKKKKVLK